MENKLGRNQLTEGNPVDNLLVLPQEVADDTVIVSYGVFVKDNGATVTLSKVDAQNSDPMAFVSATGKCRWDLIYLDVSTGLIDIITGAEFSIPKYWYDSGAIAAISANVFPLAAVYIDEVNPNAPEITAADIVDLRGFFHKIG